jgi:3-methyladenine DNA glycosylase AlkD
MSEPTLESLGDDLIALRNPAVDEAFLQRYMGTSRPILGVKTDAQRKLARTAARALPPGDAGDGFWLLLLDGLYAGPTFDHRTLAGHLLHARPAARRQLELERLRGWVRDLQGWCEVDTTCQSNWSAQELLARWDEWGPFLDALSQEEAITLRRASLVLLLTPVRESPDERLRDRAFANLARLEHERDPLITKAISWLLRSLIIHHRDAVAACLHAHATTLPAIALRETRRKLETGKK